jgi:hypothetical protein
MERSHRWKFLEHLGKKLLQVLLQQLLIGCHLRERKGLREKYGFEMLKDVVRVVIIGLECLEEIHALITAEEIANDLKWALGQLSGEQLPIPVLDLQESGQIVGLVLHQPDEASVDLLVSIIFILELALLIALEFIFIHRKGKTVN